MGEDRARPDQAEAVVDVEIIGGLRETAGDEGDLARILGEVGVHQHVGMRGDQRAGIGELLGAGGGREARRDGIAEAAAAAPPGDQGLGVGAAGGDGVAQALRPQVHQHLAGDDPHVARERGFEERVDRAGMDGGEDERAGRAVPEQLVEEEGGDLVGMAAVGEGLFGREDMAFEPLHELLAVRGDALDLRIMDMGIDEAGDDQAVQPFGRDVGEPVAEIGLGGRRRGRGRPPPRAGRPRNGGSRRRRRRPDRRERSGSRRGTPSCRGSSA